MLLRRFRERLRGQDWFEVGVELAIVIVGVFVGLQVSNWNEDRIGREQALRYRAEIAEEFRATQNSLVAMSAYYTKVRAHAVRALAALNAPRVAEGGALLIDAFQATEILPVPLNIGTYEQIRSTPILDDVAPFALQRQLATYNANLAGSEVNIESVTPYRELARGLLPYRVQEKIQAACGDVSVVDSATGRRRIELPDACAPGFTEAEIVEGVAALRSAPNLKIALNRQISDLDQKLRLLAGLAQGADVLLRALGQAR